MYFKLIIVFIFTIISTSKSARILIVQTSPCRSHVIPLQELGKVLAKRNHEITFISSFPLEKPIENYRDITVKADKKGVEIHKHISQSWAHDPDAQNFFQSLKLVTTMVYDHGNKTLQSTEIQNFLKSGEKFDLVITGYFLSEFLLGFADNFKCPSIVFFSASYFSMLHRMVGNPLSVSTAPHTMLGEIEMTFMGRLKNLIVNALDLLVMKPYADHKSREIYK